MASIYKRKDGSWCCKFQILETGNKWHYCYAGKKGDLREAQRAKTEKVLAQLEAEKEKEKDRFNPTLNNYFETWQAQRELEKAVKGNTTYKVNTIFNRHIAPIFGDKRLSEISKQDIKNFRNNLITGGKLTPATINNIIGILNKILESALDNEDENGNPLLEYNPCTPVKRKRLKEEPVRAEQHRDLISGNDLGPFFETAKQDEWQYYNACLFGLYTGMRVGEVVALKVGAIDFEKAVVEVKQTLTRTENGVICMGTPKTAESVRTIPLCADALKVVREQIELRREIAGLSISEKEEYLFFNSRLNRVNPDDINKQIRRICRLANIPCFTFHAFRNTFCFKLQAVDAPAHVIDELLGHTSRTTTGKYYTHHNIENCRKWLERAFNGPDTEQNTENAI